MATDAHFPVHEIAEQISEPELTPEIGNCYGIFRWSYDLSESVLNGGTQTQDIYLASALRGLGVFNETKL